ncbi:histamine H2 receptor-like [Nematostella vectensis]|uniref:histamine H2 receptor-like n=1 Tax=Nematostella vectensis TaxID=45351 RepID=UPI002076F425|nr:histamine H2 receptor-like [Nematostella vectensis]
MDQNSTIYHICLHDAYFDNPSDRFIQFYLTLFILYLIIAITATSSNFIVLAAIIRTPSLHNPGFTLLAGLAFSDLLFGLTVAPMLSTVNYFSYIGDFRCEFLQLVTLFTYSLGAISFSTVVLISLDRVIAINYHLRYPDIVTLPRVFKILLFVWVFFPLMAVTWRLNPGGIRKGAEMFFCILCSCGIVFVVAANVRLLLVVRRHHRAIQVQNASRLTRTESLENRTADTLRYMKSLVTIAYIALTFLLCFAPFNTLFVLNAGDSSTNPTRSMAYNVATLFVGVNSTLNPVLYCLRITELRQALIRTVADVRRALV